MRKPGRPKKLISAMDILSLQMFINEQPFLILNQQRILSFIHLPIEQFSTKQWAEIKVALREQEQSKKRQTRLQQIQFKHKNQQRLNSNELEIFKLSQQDQDRETFFNLRRALQSDLKISKALQDNQLRIETQKNKEHLKTKIEANQKRKTDNHLKYALGGLLLSIYKEKQQQIDISMIQQVEQQLRQALKLD